MTDKHLWVIIMAGGLGSRFWPISNTDCPKQFIDITGVGRSMLKLTVERFEKLCSLEHIVIVTGEAYVDRVHQQVPGLAEWQVIGEPMRRNTAPCVACAAAVIARRDPDATVIVSPADHAIFRQERFFADLRQAVQTATEHRWIVTLGAQPTRPDTSYGYIQFREPSAANNTLPDNLFEVVTFTEKPPVEMARQFIASGEFFWNTGLLVWTLPVLQEAYRKYLPALWEAFFNQPPATTHASLEEVYSQCESVSIDHGIMEKADGVYVLAASFGWSDVETWGSLYDVFRHDQNGNTVLGGNVFIYDTHNCMVALPNDPGKTVVLEGLDGYIVAASDDTLMVCRRSSEEKIFKFANDVELKQLIDKK